MTTPDGSTDSSTQTIAFTPESAPGRTQTVISPFADMGDSNVFGKIQTDFLDKGIQTGPSDNPDNNADNNYGLNEGAAQVADVQTEETSQVGDEEVTDAEEEALEEDIDEEEEEEDSRLKYKAKIDGEDSDIPEDAVIDLKVDGKLQKVSFKDLVKDYNGRVVYETKFKELAEDRKVLSGERSQLLTEKSDFEGKINAVDTKLKEVFELAQKNPVQAHLKLCKMAGLKSKEQLANYLVHASKTIDEWSGLDKPSRQALLDKIELEEARAELDERQANENKIKTQTQLKTKLDGMVQESGYEYEDFRMAANEIMTKLPHLLKDCNTEEQIAKKVLDTMAQNDAYNEVEGIASKIAPTKLSGLDKDKRSLFLNQLTQLRLQGESPKSIESFVREVFDVQSSASSATSESLKSVQKTTTTPAPKKSGKQKAEAKDFDSIAKREIAKARESGFSMI